MVIAFTGGRENKLGPDEEAFLIALEGGMKYTATFHVGDANGVDLSVRGVCVRRGYDYRIFHADWNEHGKAAGPIRNGEMIKGTDLLIAYPGGKGTQNCVAQAEAIGIPVMRRLL